MVLHAHAELDAEFGQRASFVAADLTALPFRATFDGIFSTAALHWVLDHDALFQSLFAVLRPGGWLHAQCGGGPNLARFRDRVRVLSQTSKFVPWLGTFREPWFFSDAEGAASRLRASGFVEVTAEIEEAPVFPASVEEYNGYLRTFILHRQLEFLPTELLREAFLGELASAAKADTPPFVLDYWRLNLHARTPELLR
jgi:trans-aconitate 2-methyltransferase